MPSHTQLYSSCISVNPDHILTKAVHQKFRDLHTKYNDIANTHVSMYNGTIGNVEAHVNMDPALPPQQNWRLSRYNRDKLIALQARFDQVESASMFAIPGQVRVTVEYLNLSFLVHKPKRVTWLVTAFSEVGQYSKPQPSLMPKVDGILHEIAKCKYIIISDLLHSFNQIHLA